VLNEELMVRVLNPSNHQEAYRQVRRNGGAPGVDGMRVEEYADHAARHWPEIAAKLQTGSAVGWGDDRNPNISRAAIQ